MATTITLNQGTPTTIIAATAAGAGSGFAIRPTAEKRQPQAFEWSVIISGGALSALTVNLEGSLDGVNWFSLDTWATPSNTQRAASANQPVYFIRANVTVFTVSSGTPTVTVTVGY